MTTRKDDHELSADTPVPRVLNLPSDDMRVHSRKRRVIDTRVRRALDDQGITNYVQVQNICINRICAADNAQSMGTVEASHKMEKTDPHVFCCSPPGSGKTLALLIPLVQKVIERVTPTKEVSQSDSTASCMPFAVVMSTTRELTTHAHPLLINLTKYLPEVQPLAIYGGAPRELSVQALSKGGEILCSTAGRLFDMAHNHPHLLLLQNVRYIVFNEADDWMNDRWDKDIDRLLALVHPDCALWFFISEITKQHETKLIDKYLAPDKGVVPITMTHQRDFVAEGCEPYTNVLYDVLNVGSEGKMQYLTDHFLTHFTSPNSVAQSYSFRIQRMLCTLVFT